MIKRIQILTSTVTSRFLSQVFSKLIIERRMLAGTLDEVNQAVRRYTTTHTHDRLGLVTASNYIDSPESLRSRLLMHQQIADIAMRKYEREKVHMRFLKKRELSIYSCLIEVCRV